MKCNVIGSNEEINVNEAEIESNDNSNNEIEI
jgi:hypothetical protein